MQNTFDIKQRHKPNWRSTTEVCCATHSKGVCLFPGDGGSPWCWPHLLWQWLWYGHQNEAYVEEGDCGGENHYQRIAVSLGQVGSNGRTGDQAGCKRSRYLQGRDRGKLSDSVPIKSPADYAICLEVFKQCSPGLKGPYQTVRRTPLMFLCDVSHISKYYRKRDSEDTRHWDDSKVPPKQNIGCGSYFSHLLLMRKQKEGIICFSHHGLIFISGMGAHVKKTVSSKKDLRPQTSDNAPIRGALRKDNRPWEDRQRRENRTEDGEWLHLLSDRAQESKRMCLRLDYGPK